MFEVVCMIINSIKKSLGYLIIALVYYSWRIVEKVFRKSLGSSKKSHYYIMCIFRLFFKSYQVVIKYQNPIRPDLKIKLQVDLCQNSQQWYFRLKGKYEIEWIKIIANSMHYVDNFVDIGSNLGIYAITIAQAFPTKKIIAIEPLKENFTSLRDNTMLNSISNIKLLNTAVSSCENEKIKFYPNPIHDGGGSTIKESFYRTGDIFVNAEQYQKRNTTFLSEIEISNIKIDDIIRSKSVIKIDVEGAEVSVLESGRNIFREGLVSIMVIEVLDETIDKVITLLDDYGFDCFTQDMTIPIKVGTRLSSYVGNIMCLRRESFEHRFLKEKYFQLPEINL